MTKGKMTMKLSSGFLARELGNADCEQDPFYRFLLGIGILSDNMAR